MHSLLVSYWDGYDSFWEDLPWDANPYERNSPEYFNWIDGWNDASHTEGAY